MKNKKMVGSSPRQSYKHMYQSMRERCWLGQRLKDVFSTGRVTLFPGKNVSPRKRGLASVYSLDCVWLTFF